MQASAIEQFADTRRVIRAEEFAAIETAAQLIEAARREADAIREQARQRGYAEGLAKGERDYAARLTAEQTAEAQRAAALEERMCMMVMRTLNKVLGERGNDERFFAGVVDRVLRATRDVKFLTIHVASEQQHAAQTAVDHALQAHGAPGFITVVPDAALRPGACRIESPNGLIDASLDTQLETIRQAIGGAWRASRQGA